MGQAPGSQGEDDRSATSHAPTVPPDRARNGNPVAAYGWFAGLRRKVAVATPYTRWSGTPDSILELMQQPDEIGYRVEQVGT